MDDILFLLREMKQQLILQPQSDCVSSAQKLFSVDVANSEGDDEVLRLNQRINMLEASSVRLVAVMEAERALSSQLRTSLDEERRRRLYVERKIAQLKPIVRNEESGDSPLVSDEPSINADSFLV